METRQPYCDNEQNEEVLDKSFLQVAKGVRIATGTLDGPQLAGGRTPRRWSSLRHALLTALGRVALLFVIIAPHSCVVSWRTLRRRLLLWRSSVTVIPLRGSRRASGQTRKTISIEHLEWCGRNLGVFSMI